MNNLDLQKELSFEEVQRFFSKCSEYEVSKNDDNTIKLNLKFLKSVTYNPTTKEHTHEYHNIDTLLYRPTLQTLIRDINGLGYRSHAIKPK